jgi:hypothetical protein
LCLVGWLAKDRCQESLNFSSFKVGKREGSRLIPRQNNSAGDFLVAVEDAAEDVGRGWEVVPTVIGVRLREAT